MAYARSSISAVILAGFALFDIDPGRCPRHSVDPKANTCMRLMTTGMRRFRFRITPAASHWVDRPMRQGPSIAPRGAGFSQGTAMTDKNAIAPEDTAVRVALWRALHVEID